MNRRSALLDAAVFFCDATVHNVVMNHPVTDLGYRIECHVKLVQRACILFILFFQISALDRHSMRGLGRNEKTRTKRVFENTGGDGGIRTHDTGISRMHP